MIFGFCEKVCVQLYIYSPLYGCDKETLNNKNNYVQSREAKKIHTHTHTEKNRQQNNKNTSYTQFELMN